MKILYILLLSGQASTISLLREAGNTLNDIIHNEIRGSKRRSQTYTTFSLTESMQTINPLLWDFVYVQGQWGNVVDKQIVMIHMKNVCSFFIGVILATNPSCDTTLHHLVADTVEVCGRFYKHTDFMLATSGRHLKMMGRKTVRKRMSKRTVRYKLKFFQTWWLMRSLPIVCLDFFLQSILLPWQYLLLSNSRSCNSQRQWVLDNSFGDHINCLLHTMKLPPLPLLVWLSKPDSVIAVQCNCITHKHRSPCLTSNMMVYYCGK